MTLTQTPLRQSSLLGVARDLNIAPDVAQAAYEFAASAPLFAFSGRLASGKDSVAEAAYALFGVPSSKNSLAAPLKEEVTGLMRLAADAFGYRGATVDIARASGVTRREAERVLDLLVGERRTYDEARAELATATGWDRTGEIRRALQYWGTDVRRTQNPSYWVDKAAIAAIETLATGVVPYFCDCRFPDEVVGLQRLGYQVIRLNVSPEVQSARLFGRDGIVPDAAALGHASETALDDYTGFDHVIQNDGEFDAAVEAVLLRHA